VTLRADRPAEELLDTVPAMDHVALVAVLDARGWPLLQERDEQLIGTIGRRAS
jgi:hypothetical protein